MPGQRLPAPGPLFIEGVQHAVEAQTVGRDKSLRAGIDPLAVQDIQRIVVHLKERNIGVLITDHNVRETLKITDHAYIIKEGTIFRSGTPDMLSSDLEVRKVYLGEQFRLY